jgi:hypothetical protein
VLQPEKAEPPIDVKWFVIVALFKPLQLKKAELPIVVTELGIKTLVKPMQP